MVGIMLFKSLLESFLMMKGSKAKASNSQSQLPDYELQRLRKLKHNAERMSAQGSGSLANKILQQKTRDILCSSVRQTDDGSSEDFDTEQETLGSEKRQVCEKVSSQQHPVPTREIQRKQQEQQLGSTKAFVKKRAFCSPGSMSAYLEFRKRQKDEALMMSSEVREKGQNYDDEQLNEADCALQFDYEGNEAAERAFMAQFGTEETSSELSSKRKKHRGRTMLHRVHARSREERPVIVLNSLGQPVGPTKEIVQEFKFFLGTVARDSELAPLNYRNFPSLPTLDKILDYVQEKYMVPHAGLNWVMDAVNSCWKYYKCQIKKKHFYAYDTDDSRWEHKPDTISDQMFLDLLQYWHTDEAKAISQSNKSNRLMLDDMHTLGRKSYAILRHELQQQDPDKKEPSQAKVYKELRKRSAERTYISSFEKAKENIDKIDALESAQSQEDGNVCNDPYSEVIPPPKRKSRLHLYGSGVKKSDLKNKDTKSNYILPEEFLVGIKTQLVQEIAPTITAAVLDLIREVNPRINLVVPSTLQQLTPHDASSAPNRNTAQSGQSSKSFNQVVDDDELPRDE
uniref:Uncharacterized protein n=3 Tax=Chenopodium quinoa TaxID=63459 RepID=A0A803MJS2_CHEQI